MLVLFLRLIGNVHAQGQEFPLGRMVDLFGYSLFLNIKIALIPKP